MDPDVQKIRYDRFELMRQQSLEIVKNVYNTF